MNPKGIFLSRGEVVQPCGMGEGNLGASRHGHQIRDIAGAAWLV
jgi:hypothetical protein